MFDEFVDLEEGEELHDLEKLIVVVTPYSTGCKLAEVSSVPTT